MRGCVTKKGKGWYVVVDLGPDAEGKRRQKWHSGYRTKKAAEAALAAIVDSLQTGAYVEPARLTVGAYLRETWLPHVRPRLAARTAARYAEIVETHLVPALGGIALPKLSPLAIQEAYRHALETGRRVAGRTAGLAPRTVLHHHRLLHEALGQAVKWQLLARNPCDAVEPPRPARTERPALDGARAARLLDLARASVLYGPVGLAVATGLRRGEIFGLRWADCDLDRGTLAVRQTLEKTIEVVEGQRRVRLGFKAPKTAKGRRTVSLPPLAVTLLRAHKAEQARARLLLADTYQDHGLVFAAVDGTPVDPDTVTKAFRRLARKAGLPAGFTFHDLRHSHASISLKAGVGLRVVSDRLGHASAAFTLATYGHMLEGQDLEAADRVEAALRGAGAGPGGSREGGR